MNITEEYLALLSKRPDKPDAAPSGMSRLNAAGELYEMSTGEAVEFLRFDAPANVAARAELEARIAQGDAEDLGLVKPAATKHWSGREPSAATQALWAKVLGGAA